MDPDQPLTALGLDSLRAVEIAVAIEEGEIGVARVIARNGPAN